MAKLSSDERTAAAKQYRERCIGLADEWASWADVPAPEDFVGLALEGLNEALANYDDDTGISLLEWIISKVNRALKNAVAHKHISMCTHQAYKWASWANVPNPEDLFGPALEGLANALESYEDDKGTKLPTWIIYKVKCAIMDELRRRSPIPQEKKRWLADIKRAQDMLEGLLGRPPMQAEIAQKLGITTDELDRRLHTGLMGRELQEASGNSDMISVNMNPQASMASRQAWESLSIEDKVAVRMHSYRATYEDIGVVLDEKIATVGRRFKKIRERLEGSIE